jgi:hypothetical protein
MIAGVLRAWNFLILVKRLKSLFCDESASARLVG